MTHNRACLICVSDDFDLIPHSRSGANLAQQQPIIPRFPYPPSDVRVTEGQPIRLECKLEGRPRPDVTWYSMIMNEQLQ